ncbi:MAG: helix-turn-helix transcriptional regulator [Candidatus Aenigmarchaeota archaeon]|nr:helix-turn-helix transcriptional regulator [Candidatus Aenigmarchaeota archaeon]
MEAVSKTINTVGTRHRLEVVCRLLISGSSNFNELKRALRMNSTTLSRTLKFLEKRGIVDRRVTNTQPISVNYSLTGVGQEFSDIIECMNKWGKKLLRKDKITLQSS